MKRLALLLLVLLFLTSVSPAGDPKPVAYSGAKALLFDLGGLAFLAAGDYGGGLGMKYYVAPDLALRFSLGFRTSSQTDKNLQSPLPPGRVDESTLTNTEFILAPAVTYNVAKSSTVAAYVGGMVSFNTSKAKREGNSGSLGVDYDSGESHRESTTGWGIAALLGVEWFPWENVSFSGEYRLGFTSSSTETESTTSAASVTVDGPTTTSFGLGSANNAALTLSVYF